MKEAIEHTIDQLHVKAIMIRYISLLGVMAICCTNGQSQSSTASVVRKGDSSILYTDILVSGNDLWALSTSGKLVRFDPASGNQRRDVLQPGETVTILSRDQNGYIVIADQNNAVKRYDTMTNSWTTINVFSPKILGITFNSRNNGYLITEKGIVDMTTLQTYYPLKSQNPAIRHSARWFHKPVCYMDRTDHCWIGFGYGEWGGDLFIFDTKTKQFISPDMKKFNAAYLPVKSIFEARQHVYVTSSLQHFMISGSIARFDGWKAEAVLRSQEHKQLTKDTAWAKMIDGEYIGPGAFNPADSSIYFYSQNGIFKGNPSGDLSKIEKWTKVLTPALHWSSGQPDAIGSPMNVFKLLFWKNKLIFCTQEDGIGIFDGEGQMLVH